MLAATDDKKGEKLVLVADHPQVELPQVREILKSKGFSELAQPREIKYVKEIPKLGTGKVDYVKLKEMVG